MKILASRLSHLPVRFSAPALLLAGIATIFASAHATPQASSTRPVARISAEISTSQMAVVPGSKHPLAQAEFDTGRLSSATRLEGVSLNFSRTQKQEADLQALLAAQQNPSSPLYHQWLNPDEFASRFGMADSDIAKVQSWLEQQGFSIDSVSRSKNSIRFSGSAAQVESAFATELHTYLVRGVKHFAPSTALSVPSALAGVVEAVRNVDDFRPVSHIAVNRRARPKPAFTSSQSGDVFFAPGDIATVYDVQKEYNGGYTGTGQSIAIVGQSGIALSDIEAFQSAAGLTVKDPTVLLVPGSGASTVYAGDETESDLDLEWSGAIAKGAAITFVYTGSNTAYSAFDALQYAIDNRLANIISSSYGTCETELGGQTLETVLAQAASQGQTVISAAGDSGSTDCYVGSTTTDPTQAVQQALAVDYPASSPYVTGIGGTEISTASNSYLTPGDGYWETAGSSDVISSALQYIPEQVWNEDGPDCGTDDCLSSGGGGASKLFPKPTWQEGVPGIPSDGKRDVPDISLNAATGLPGYLFCTSDTSFWSTGQVASCNSGFRDASTGILTYAGGTSFGAPIFAGMLALINQQQGYTTGQGLVNQTLYTLASDSATYASAFHDITTGNNDCLAGSTYCSSTAGFSAGVGYDQASGLGSLDLYNLASAWPANSESSPIATTTTVAASNSAPLVNASDTFTITVASATGTTIPTGTVSITVDSGTPITGNALTANGTFTYTTSFAAAGTHQVLATYSGDATHAASTGSVSINVAVVSSGSGSFTLAATNITVAQGSSGSSTITVKPAGGYTGTVDLSFDTSNDNALQNLCYEFTTTTTTGDGTVIVSGTSPVTTQLTFDTNASDCASGNVVRGSNKHAFRTMHRTTSSRNENGNGTKTAPVAIAFAGLMLAGFLGRYSRKFRGLACLILLGAIGLAVSACGGSSSNTLSNPPKGTYTVTVTGQDTATASIPSANATFTFTIQ